MACSNSDKFSSYATKIMSAKCCIGPLTKLNACLDTSLVVKERRFPMHLTWYVSSGTTFRDEEKIILMLMFTDILSRFDVNTKESTTVERRLMIDL